MGRTVMTVPIGEAPKRGDLLYTNCGDRRERTWFVLRVHQLRSQLSGDYKSVVPRFQVWRERWWELEPAFRMSLYRSAERRGGQTVWFQEPRPAFEDLRRSHR